MPKASYEIKNRWTGKVIFAAGIDCAPDAPESIKLGMADLTGANLRDADLTGADLTGADLTGADLTGADLSDAPIIQNIHKAVYDAASQPGALDMSLWHCGTAHCRAGWVVALAGEDGAKLEGAIGTASAACAIYLASDPDLFRIEPIPDFYCDNATALADMRRLAERAPS